MINKENGVSLFAQSADLFTENDPLDELFALNLGDFLSEHLISPGLVQKISENKKDKRDGLVQQIKELTSLYSTNKTLAFLGAASFEEKHEFYYAIAKTIAKMFELKTCRIYLRGAKPSPDGRKKPNIVAKYGRYYEKYNYYKLAFQKRKPIEYDNSVYVPMCYNSLETIGVILLGSDTPIAKEYVELAEIIAKLFATSMSLQEEINKFKKMNKRKRDTNERDFISIRAELTSRIADLCEYQQAFVERLAVAVDKKGQYTVAHSQNTANLARQICKELNLNEKTTDLIYYAGLLQNIGKMVLPGKLFNQKGKLNKANFEKIKKNSGVGIHFLMNINFLSEVVPYILYRTERVDGSGTPEGLKGNSIPLGSRIIAVADAYCALTSDRPFRKALSTDDALDIMIHEIGKKWDIVVINALAKIVG